MIRLATPNDIAAIVRMVEKLHIAARILLPVDLRVTARFVRTLISTPTGLLLVAVDDDDKPRGFLAASVGAASIAMTPVAIEHGWYSEGGGGRELLARYVDWASEQGCYAVRMSSPPDTERVGAILARSGFAMAEQAWIKVL